MRKILLHSGMSPFDNPSFGDILTYKFPIGGNLGNLLYVNAIARLLLTDDSDIVSTYYHYDYTEEELDRINNTFDCFIIPLADAFRHDYIPYLNELANLIRRLTIPCVVIGVGLRADYDQRVLEYVFDDDVRNFVEAVLEKSAMLGLRGSFTGEYLSRLGFREGRDYTVIGCPSLYYYGSKLSVKEGQKNVEDLAYAFNCTQLGNESVVQAIESIASGVANPNIVLQEQTEMRHYYLGRRWTIRGGSGKGPQTVYGSNIYNTMYTNKRVFAFSNIHTWMNYLKMRDISVNTRFHGSVASILAGIPTLVIPIDSRMRELAEYHGLTVVKPSWLERDDNLKRWIERVDFHSCERVAESNFRHYLDFLKCNRVKNIYTHSDLTAVRKYDSLVGDIPWRHELPFNDVGATERLTRIVTVYASEFRNGLSAVMRI